MEWTWAKNTRAAEAFLKLDQLMALIRAAQHGSTLCETPQGTQPLLTEDQVDAALELAASLAGDVQRLLRQVLPDPLCWEMRAIHQAMRSPAPVPEVLG